MKYLVTFWSISPKGYKLEKEICDYNKAQAYLRCSLEKLYPVKIDRIEIIYPDS